MVDVRIEGSNNRIRNIIKSLNPVRKIPTFQQRHLLDSGGWLNISWKEYHEAGFWICLAEYDLGKSSRTWLTINRPLLVLPVILNGSLDVTLTNGKSLEVFSSQFQLLPLQKGERIRLTNHTFKGLVCIFLFEPQYFHAMENVYATAKASLEGNYLFRGKTFLFMDVHMQQVIKYVLTMLVGNNKPDTFRMAICVRSFVVMALAELDRIGSSGIDVPIFTEWQVNNVREAAAFLIENLDVFPGTGKLAQRAGMNVTTFRKVFFTIMGNKAHEYWALNRMHTARQWLIQRKLKPIEIARTLGFSSSQSFNKQFKKQFGTTPSEMYKYGGA